MPLTPTTPDAICDIDAISFVMLDGDSFVRVDVQRTLLEHLTHRYTDQEHLAAFDEHRAAIEQIASAKYDQGDFRSFANSRVVPIATADLIRYESAALPHPPPLTRADAGRVPARSP
jgi:hypothetical protein